MEIEDSYMKVELGVKRKTKSHVLKGAKHVGK